MATQRWTGDTGCGSPSPQDFPSAPQGVTSPPSLENLSCVSPNAGQTRPPEPISYVTLQEQRCVLSWFQGWTDPQKERFSQDLLGKAVPGKVCTLLDSLSTLQVKDRLPNIFECQLRLWTQWFESWGEEERNHFLHMLEDLDPLKKRKKPIFVSKKKGCHLCHNTFSEPDVVVSLPGEVPVHTRE